MNFSSILTSSQVRSAKLAIWYTLYKLSTDRGSSTRNQIYTPTLGSIFMLGDVLLVLNATLINISLNGQFYGGESGEKHRFPNFTIPFSCNVVASI